MNSNESSGIPGARDQQIPVVSNDGLKMAFDFIPDAFCILHPDGYMNHHNPACKEILGYSIEELVATRFIEFIHPDDQKATIAEIEKQSSGQDIMHLETRWRRKDGSFRYLAWRGTAAEGGVVYVTARDITEYKQTEEDALTRAHLNNLLLDSLPHAAMLIRKDRTVIAANRIALDAGAKIGNYCWKEFAHSEFIPELDKEQIASHCSSDCEGIHCTFCIADQAMESAVPMNDPAVHAFGRIWDTYWIPLDDEIYLHYSCDVTERRESEKALESMLSYAIDPLYKFDLINSKYEYFSPSVINTHGYSPEEMLSGGIEKEASRIHPDDLVYLQGHVDELLSGATIGKFQQVIEYRFRHKTCGYRWISDSRSLVHDANGTPVAIHGSFRDVTDHKELEEQLRQSEKMTAIGQLAGGIAHDFNNQLSGVLAYADMLENRLEDEKLCKYARNIRKGAKRAAELTTQLLAFSRKGKNLSVPVSIHKVIAEVSEILEHSIDKRIKIRQALNASPTTAIGDPNQLQNAILNMALNARDAMPDGGDLVFETDVVELDEGFCQLHTCDIDPGNYLHISIIDNGIGMDTETQKHVFEPFYTTKDVGKGTGMGLASVYGTIHNHMGTVDVCSESGRGTTFHIYLPLAEDLREEEEIYDHGPPITGTARILVVDDEQMILGLASDILENLGYTITTCNNGKEAVRYYEESWKDIDLVILDMVMPELGGRDTFAAMKKINPTVRAILSSGYNINGEAQSILDDGVMAFVGKPYIQTELAEKVAQVLRGGDELPVEE